MKKALPTGVSDYQKLWEEGYYTIDKTLMIKEFLERKSEVTLITRPRRFGKTSNMSMMSEFFDITKNAKELFQNMKIAETAYYSEMNQYPAIYLSFSNCKDGLMNITKMLIKILRLEYAKHRSTFESDKYDKDITEATRKQYQLLCQATKLSDVNDAILTLSQFLHEAYHKRVMIFIDEYDTPFIEAHTGMFYDEVKGSLSLLLQSALKDNKSLQYAMLTGIQRVAKENIFSHLNNVEVFSVNDPEYSAYFGFNEDETRNLLEYYGLSLNDEVKAMYDGYNMGDTEIYNPWSIVNYAKRKKLDYYWVNTSGNAMIKNAMRESDVSFKEGYETLIKQGFLDTQVSLDTSFYETRENSNLWGLFVNAGYLTILESLSYNRSRVRIPNKEVENEFINLTAYYLHVSDSTLLDMFAALSEKRLDAFLKFYRLILLDYPSYYDLKGENSYHMLLLGMSIILRNQYEISSNREVGKGRNDIILKARNKKDTSFIIELKYSKDKGDLKKIAEQAITQIKAQEYDHAVSGEVIYIGLSHCGKEVEMVCEQNNK